MYDLHTELKISKSLLNPKRRHLFSIVASKARGCVTISRKNCSGGLEKLMQKDWEFIVQNATDSFFQQPIRELPWRFYVESRCHGSSMIGCWKTESVAFWTISFSSPPEQFFREIVTQPLALDATKVEVERDENLAVSRRDELNLSSNLARRDETSFFQA